MVRKSGNKAIPTQCLQVQVCIYTYADPYFWDRCIEPRLGWGPYHSMVTNHGVGNFSCAAGEETDREHAYVTAGFKPLTAFNKIINWPAGL